MRPSWSRCSTTYPTRLATSSTPRKNSRVSCIPRSRSSAISSWLIDTEKDQYPGTRQWAEAIHAQHPDIQGLSWVSRQDDSARAVVLFGDRVPKGTLQQVGDSRNLLQDEQAYAELLDLAERIGVDVTPEK